MRFFGFWKIGIVAMTTEEKRANLFSLTQDILAIDRLLDELDDPEAELTQIIDRLAAIEFEVFWLLENWDCGDDD